MTKDEALTFLRKHQPMPPTVSMPESLAQTYESVRCFFLLHPTKECIPLLLNSFGEGDCFGIYQLVGDVIRQFAPDDVLPHLVQALTSESSFLHYWNAQIATHFPSGALIAPLAGLLSDAEPDIRYAAITALEQIGSREVIAILESHKAKEADPEIRELIEEVLSEQTR